MPVRLVIAVELKVGVIELLYPRLLQAPQRLPLGPLSVEYNFKDDVPKLALWRVDDK